VVDESPPTVGARVATGPLAGIARSNVALATTAFTAGLVLVKILRVVHNDVRRASALLTVLDTAAMLKLLFVALVPPAVGLAAAWATVVALRAGLVRGEWVSLTMGTAVILVALAVFVSPWYILVPTLLVGALAELIARRPARQATATDVNERRAKLTETTSALEAALRDADEGLDDAQAQIDALDAKLAELATLDVDKWQAGRADREEAAAYLEETRKETRARADAMRSDLAQLDLDIAAMERAQGGLQRIVAERTRFDTVARLITVVLVLLFVVLSSEPWLARERIDLTDGTSRVGFVIKDTSQWTTILTDVPRDVIYVPSDTIAARTICQTSARQGPDVTVFDFLFAEHRAPVPACAPHAPPHPTTQPTTP
jgi:hypothetical protein